MGLLAAAALPNCRCDDGLTSNPTPDIQLKDPVTAAVNDDPEDTEDGNAVLAIDFGAGDVGVQAHRTVEVLNKGGANLSIKRISFAPADASDTRCPVPSANIKFGSSADQAPRTLAGGVTGDPIHLTFDPAGGSHCRVLVVESDDPDEAIVKVYLSASGQGPRLCVEPDTMGVVDFGTARPTTTKRKSVTIKSCGTRGLTVSSIAIEQLNAVFSVESPASAPAGELPPCDGTNDATCSFPLNLAFTPTAGGVFAGTLTVTTTGAAGSTPYPFQLTGKGAECSLVVNPTTVQFGAVASNGSATQTVLLRNNGVCHCTVDALTAVAPADQGFSLVSPPATPLVLKGSDGCDGDPELPAGATNTAVLQVKYEPGVRTSPSVNNASFHVQSASNTAMPDTTVNLEATGGGTPRCELSVDPLLAAAGGTGNPFQILPENQETYKRYGLVRFGNVTKNFTKRSPIKFKNTGNTNCEINGVAWDGASTGSHHFGLEDSMGGAVNVGGSPGWVIAPGEEFLVNATYTPLAAGEKWNGAASLMLTQKFLVCGGSNPFLPNTCEGNGIKFSTNAQNIDTTAIGGAPGVISVGFNAASVAPAIDVIPGEVDFGTVTLGCGSEEREVKIYNTGSADLRVASASISPAAMPVEFRVTASPAPPTAVVAPGGSIRVKVRFYPRRVGLHNANLVITTEEGTNQYGEFTVPLKGNGTTDSHVVDTFRQLNEPLVDVLWVVDDSGSMSDEQQALATNFPLFFSQTSINNVNFHISLTTTLYSDGCIPDITNPTAPCNSPPNEKAGWSTACTGNDRIISPTTPMPASQFSCDVEVATASHVRPSRPESSSQEAGLGAAKLFLSPPNITDPAINGGFLRDDAKLYVIVVSDEEDQSPGPTGLYVDFFQNLKGYRNRSLVSFSAIAGHVPGGCGENAEAGTRYKDVVDAVGNGIFHDICLSDFGAQLQSLAFDSFGLKTQFFLSRNADPAHLTVCVGDQDFAANPAAPCTTVAQTTEGAPMGYFYEASTNSVVFNAGSVPARGKYIKVEFEAACYPQTP